MQVKTTPSSQEEANAWDGWTGLTNGGSDGAGAPPQGEACEERAVNEAQRGFYRARSGEAGWRIKSRGAGEWGPG